MNIPNECIDIYNQYLKNINEVKKEVKSIQNIRRKAIKKGVYATEKEILNIESNEIDDNAELNSKKNIRKIYKFSNGDTYIGHIFENKMEGKGVYIFAEKEELNKEKQSDNEEDSMCYIGNFSNNMKDGKGEFTFREGDIYTGFFKDDRLDGIGQMIYSSGDEYIGNWKDGQKDGIGIYRWKNGWMYIGDFKSSKMEGSGTCYDNYGNVIYDGEWKNNLIHGQGTYIWDESKKYEGEFKHGKKHGQGTFYINGELVYQGTWKFDKPSIFNMSLDEIFSLKA